VKNHINNRKETKCIKKHFTTLHSSDDFITIHMHSDIFLDNFSQEKSENVTWNCEWNKSKLDRSSNESEKKRKRNSILFDWFRKTEQSITFDYLA
jgi:hypothetical protein